MISPGVIIEERGEATVLTRTSPTVPAMIGLFHKPDGTRYTTADCFKVSGMADLRRAFPNLMNMQVKIAATGATVEACGHEYGFSAMALEHYFINGGGPCYILPSAGRTDAEFDTSILKFQEISLIAVIDPTDAADVYQDALEGLLNERKGYFAIRHMKTASAAPDVLTAGPQRSLYHPWLYLTHSPWRNDAAIPVMYADSTTQTTLADLKTADPAAYALADAAVKKQILAFTKVPIPPSACVAAAYCKTDRERGIWKAPANIVITNAAPRTRVTDTEQADLNDKGINAIRIIDGQTTIWGARTCEVTDRQWRYINVRRLFNQVERDISDVMQRYMYEPNTPATWVRAKTSISNYLYNLWQLGAFQGARPEDGYQVSLGLDESMSATDIEEGKMIACLRLAPSKPAEFIVLLFSQDMV